VNAVGRVVCALARALMVRRKACCELVKNAPQVQLPKLSGEQLLTVDNKVPSVLTLHLLEPRPVD
jgi:hypothetical protein